MMRFNYEILADVKKFLFDMKIHFRFIFMADDETNAGGPAATMKAGGKLFETFFFECFWRP